MRPTKICEEEIEKILAMSDEDEEDFSISESEFEANLLEEGMNSSEDDSSDNSEDWNEEPPPQAPQDNIIPFSKRFLRGKNKYKWATTKGKRRRSAINIVHHARGPTGAAKKPLSRREFMKKLHSDLVKPHMAERLKNPNLHSELQQNIRDILSVPVEEASVENVPSKKKNKRKICSICPYKKHRMTKSVCSKCMKHVCGEHKVEICAYCAKL